MSQSEQDKIPLIYRGNIHINIVEIKYTLSMFNMEPRIGNLLQQLELKLNKTIYYSPKKIVDNEYTFKTEILLRNKIS